MAKTGNDTEHTEARGQELVPPFTSAASNVIITSFPGISQDLSVISDRLYGRLSNNNHKGNLLTNVIVTMG